MKIEIEPVDLNIASAIKAYQSIKGDKKDLDIEVGICFGSALCHGVFSMIGKLPWWQAVRQAIVEWDKTPQSLSTIVFLPDDAKAYTLESLIQMAGNFLLTHESIDLVSEKFEIGPYNSKQRELLQVGGAFQIVTSIGTKKIQDKLSFIFKDHEDFIKFMNTFRGCYNNNEVICLLYKSIHVTTLRSQDRLYIFNGNDSEGPIQEDEISYYDDATRRRGKLYKICLWSHLGKQSDTDTIGVDILSFDGKINLDLVNLSKALTKHALENLDAYVLCAMCRVMPEAIPQLLTEIENNLEKQTQLANALTGGDLYRGSNGLSLLVQFAPSALPQLLALVKEKPTLQQGFIQAFSQLNGYSVLGGIIDNAPDTLPILFQLADSLPLLKDGLANSFVNSESAFLKLMVKAPKCLSDFFTLCQKSQELQNGLARIMYRDEEIITGDIGFGNRASMLSIFVAMHPEYVSEFLKFVPLDPLLSKRFAWMLAEKPTVGWPLLHLIIKKSPSCLPALIALAKSNNEILQAIQNTMPLEVDTGCKDKPRENGFEFISRFAPQFQSQFNELFLPKASSGLETHSMFSNTASLQSDTNKLDFSIEYMNMSL